MALKMGYGRFPAKYQDVQNSPRNVSYRMMVFIMGFLAILSTGALIYFGSKFTQPCLPLPQSLANLSSAGSYKLANAVVETLVTADSLGNDGFNIPLQAPTHQRGIEFSQGYYKDVAISQEVEDDSQFYYIDHALPPEAAISTFEPDLALNPAKPTKNSALFSQMYKLFHAAVNTTRHEVGTCYYGILPYSIYGLRQFILRMATEDTFVHYPYGPVKTEYDKQREQLIVDLGRDYWKAYFAKAQCNKPDTLAALPAVYRLALLGGTFAFQQVRSPHGWTPRQVLHTDGGLLNSEAGDAASLVLPKELHNLCSLGAIALPEGRDAIIKGLEQPVQVKILEALRVGMAVEAIKPYNDAVRGTFDSCRKLMQRSELLSEGAAQEAVRAFVLAVQRYNIHVNKLHLVPLAAQARYAELHDEVPPSSTAFFHTSREYEPKSGKSDTQDALRRLLQYDVERARRTRQLRDSDQDGWWEVREDEDEDQEGDGVDHHYEYSDDYISGSSLDDFRRVYNWACEPLCHTVRDTPEDGGPGLRSLPKNQPYRQQLRWGPFKGRTLLQRSLQGNQEEGVSATDEADVKSQVKAGSSEQEGQQESTKRDKPSKVSARGKKTKDVGSQISAGEADGGRPQANAEAGSSEQGAAEVRDMEGAVHVVRNEGNSGQEDSSEINNNAETVDEKDGEEEDFANEDGQPVLPPVPGVEGDGPLHLPPLSEGQRILYLLPAPVVSKFAALPVQVQHRILHLFDRGFRLLLGDLPNVLQGLHEGAHLGHKVQLPELIHLGPQKSGSTSMYFCAHYSGLFQSDVACVDGSCAADASLKYRVTDDEGTKEWHVYNAVFPDRIGDAWDKFILEGVSAANVTNLEGYPMAMDLSPAYLKTVHTAVWAYLLAPDPSRLRFIVSLREPNDRLVSEIAMLKSAWDKKLNLSSVIEREVPAFEKCAVRTLYACWNVIAGVPFDGGAPLFCTNKGDPSEQEREYLMNEYVRQPEKLLDVPFLAFQELYVRCDSGHFFEGMYAMHLHMWFRLFSKRQFTISPQSALSAMSLAENLVYISHVTGYYLSPHALKQAQRLEDMMDGGKEKEVEKDPILGPLKHKMGFCKMRHVNGYSDKFDREPHEESLAKLKDRYDGHSRALERLVPGYKY